MNRLTGALSTLLAAFALVGAANPAAAQDFPIKGKPIRVIVAFPPGGGADGQARSVSQRLREILGTTAMVENRPGAGTLLAASEGMKSAPDRPPLVYTASA